MLRLPSHTGGSQYGTEGVAAAAPEAMPEPAGTAATRPGLPETCSWRATMEGAVRAFAKGVHDTNALLREATDRQHCAPVPFPGSAPPCLAKVQLATLVFSIWLG